MNHMKMSELEEQRSKLACEVECLKAAAKSCSQSEQQWKGFLYIFILVLSLYKIYDKPAVIGASRIGYTNA